MKLKHTFINILKLINTERYVIYTAIQKSHRDTITFFKRRPKLVVQMVAFVLGVIPGAIFLIVLTAYEQGLIL